MKKIFLIILFLLLLPALALADIQRQRGVKTYLPFFIWNYSTGALISGATALTCQYAKFTSNTAPTSFVNFAEPEVEVGSTGFYYVPANGTEMQAQFMLMRCTSTSPGAWVWSAVVQTNPTSSTTHP